MITFKIISEILNAKSYFCFDSTLIKAINQILAQNPNAGSDTTLSSKALWLLAEAYLENENAFDAYKNIPSSDALKNAIVILSKFKKNNMLIEANAHLLTDLDSNKYILYSDDTPEASFLIQNIAQFKCWKRVVRWLDHHKLFTLANLQAIAPHIISFDSATGSYSTLVYEYTNSLNEILIRNPENAEVILNVINKNQLENNYQKNNLFVRHIKDYKITDKNTISVLSKSLIFLDKSTPDIKNFILSRHAKLKEWMHALNFLIVFGIEAIVNLQEIEKQNIDNLVPAFNKATTSKYLFSSATDGVFEFILAYPQHIDLLMKHPKHAKGLNFLLNKRPAVAGLLDVNGQYASAARNTISLLSENNMLEDSDLNFIFDNLALTPYLHNCVNVLAISGLLVYYNNIIQERASVEAISELSDALELLSNRENKVISKEEFETVWNFSAEFAKARRLLLPEKNDSDFILAHPMHAESITAALLCIQLNNELEPYKYLILRHPEHAQPLMFALRDIKKIKIIEKAHAEEVINFIIANPADATTSAQGYIRLVRMQKMTHAAAYELMSAHPKYISDIALARQYIDETKLDIATKNLLKHRLAYEIEGDVPVVNNSDNVVMNYEQITLAFMGVNSDYVAFFMGKTHAANKLNTPHYFYNARLNFKKIPPTSAWYLSAQQELCELLYHACIAFQKAEQHEAFAEYKTELDDVIQILEKSGKRGVFLDNFSKSKDSNVFDAKANPLIECIADTKTEDKQRSIGVQTNLPVNHLWRLKPLAKAPGPINNASASASQTLSI